MLKGRKNDVNKEEFLSVLEKELEVLPEEKTKKSYEVIIKRVLTR